MNIAHCIHGLGLGGAQQIIKFIVRERDERVFHHYIYSSSGGLFRPDLEQAGAIVRIIERKLPKLDPFWVSALSRAMRHDAIDVVHTHLFGDSLHGLLAARAAGNLPVVMTLHIGPEGQSWLQRLGYRWLLSRSTRNVACTESVARSWRGVQTAHIETISNGIETQAISPADDHARSRARAKLGLNGTEHVIGSVGRLVEQKGFQYLISAFARLRRSLETDLRLVLVGEGPLRTELQRQGEREGVGAQVLFTETRLDVRDLLLAFDVVAFSSDFEGLPIALIEAMAAARCIVTTDAPGILDAVTDGREALVVPRRNPARLADAFAHVLREPRLRWRLGEAARKRFMQDFTAERMLEKYEAVYRDVHRSVAGLEMAAISQHRIPSKSRRSSV